jgi:hypothetical protein
MTHPDSLRNPPLGGAEERADWFYDELMTPQPDATQAYFRDRLKALAAAPTPKQDANEPDASA